MSHEVACFSIAVSKGLCFFSFAFLFVVVVFFFVFVFVFVFVFFLFFLSVSRSLKGCAGYFMVIFSKDHAIRCMYWARGRVGGGELQLLKLILFRFIGGFFFQIFRVVRDSRSLEASEEFYTKTLRFVQI